MNKNSRMKTKISLPLVAIVIAVITHCSCGNNSARKSRVPDGHTSELSLDWQGTYSGNLPCADCERIETELTLNHDRTFMLISNYIKGENSLSDTIEGNFSWQGNNVLLEGIPENEGSSLFKVEENQVRWLNVKGKEITGNLASHYILTKNGNPLVEVKRWQLIELYGKPVEGTPETHYLIFDPEEGRASAKAGCNILMFSYKIKFEYRIEFTRGISTLMACPDDLEDQLLQVLDETDNLSTDGTYLSLNKARMAPLARFRAIE